ncbi:hypothetical protein [Mycolicibacterium peregrinum]|uniref:LppP/LprE family lipoprotein n=1 Tax=Mycolicibacterium peregrinum TaxID=43304 RepID=A0A4Z0HIC4_MYCPR|nr:hypothetical protein [Mycolicibacterium peregrinum]TGB35924.1 hypothetical protein EJD98_30700 [Mycolicibacterium peregrinum]TGB36675.1 hypothetical protein EJD94_28420 [Mycolicibacterium peregrinum]
MISPTKAFTGAIPLAALLSVTACGGTQQAAKTSPAEASSTAASTTQALDTESTSAPATNSATALPESCTATPAGAFGLTRVDLTPAAGHSDGAKTVRWTTNSPMPVTGTVAFTLVSGTIMRGVKFNDGALIANYVFHPTVAPQDNLTIPPQTDGNTVSALIPAAAVAELGSTWSADVEVDAESTGKCVP